MKQIKLTNSKILSSVNLISAVTQKQLPVRSAYAIAKNIKVINDEIKNYQEMRTKIIDENSKKDDTGKPVKDKTGNPIIDDENKDKFQKEMQELLDIEVELNIMQFKLDNLGAVNFSVSELESIDFMLEDF